MVERFVFPDSALSESLPPLYLEPIFESE